MIRSAAAVVATLAGCAMHAPEEVVIESPPHAVAASPAPPPSPSPIARYHMRRHFDDLRLIERLLIAGKLAEGTTLGVLLVREDDEPAMVPFKPHAERVSRAADALAHAGDLDDALRKTALLSAGCAACHTAVSARLRLQPPPPVPEQPVMARHAWAADRLWEGMIAGDTDRWRRGLAVLADSPFGSPPSRLPSFAQAQLASYSTDPELRADAYGKILHECATCHTRLRIERP